jgi:Flp pilus assembly pilin Flp
VFGSNPISGYLHAVIAYLPLVFVAIVIAALDQLHIAADVVNAVLYAVLAALVGIAIVAVGGGGIKTMAQRWEAVAARYDEEKPRFTAAARNAPALSDQVRGYAGGGDSAPGTVARPRIDGQGDPATDHGGGIPPMRCARAGSRGHCSISAGQAVRRGMPSLIESPPYVQEKALIFRTYGGVSLLSEQGLAAGGTGFRSGAGYSARP